ncbi:helix-hairpin-helix domain-containing protein [Paludifilum halophilum]|uniref:helix-hairpin-helix domain-containing protein n=1 Tax=Paludifilum halophilum TaxID=1642702 RepID=UPI00146BA216|nr:helix-hairpin-helix domain-containing protein [Paludifilum halophilum]
MLEEEWSPREKKMAVAMVVLVLALAGLAAVTWLGGEEAEEPPLPPYEPEEQAKPKEEDRREDEKAKEVVVDVKGAVKKPGVYRMESEARVQDAVEEAGGPRKQADMDRVNLAQPLSDGMALYIPKQGEEASPLEDTVAGGGEPASGNGAGSKVNVNAAQAAELEELQGIGPSKAEAIIRYREENGSFSSLEELTEVPGIGEKTLENFRDQVTLR